MNVVQNKLIEHHTSRSVLLYIWGMLGKGAGVVVSSRTIKKGAHLDITVQAYLMFGLYSKMHDYPKYINFETFKSEHAVLARLNFIDCSMKSCATRTKFWFIIPLASVRLFVGKILTSVHLFMVKFLASMYNPSSCNTVAETSFQRAKCGTDQIEMKHTGSCLRWYNEHMLT